jgi:hypothetical protein
VTPKSAAKWTEMRSQGKGNFIWRIGIAVLLGASAVAHAADTPYNAGVDAWHKKNYVEAARQWSTAVLAGDINAMNNLAYLYSNGMGVARKNDVALRLWLAAAYSGQSESQWHLGTVYEEGKGVPRDIIRAYAWYGCAIVSAKRLSNADASGTEAKIEADAQASFDVAKAKLDPDQLPRAEVLRSLLVQRYGIIAP